MKPSRIQSIDALRGLVMIVMALDHIRDFFHYDAALHSPVDLHSTTAALFLTRWVTHFCAPTFIFLTGLSAYLYGQKHSSKELTRFLFTRGAWLIFLEVTVVAFGWFFDFNIHGPVLMVIWAIGAAMIFLSLVVQLPYLAIVAVGVAITFFHNLGDNVHFTNGTFVNDIWIMLHGPGRIQISEQFRLNCFYPLLPYFGLICLGYAFGKLFGSDTAPEKRKKALLWIGTSCIALFVVLRFLNVYGDPQPWEHQSQPLFTVLSFINCTKYPVSLLFALMILGPSILFLYFFEGIQNRFTKILTTIGKVPMFYYIIHIYLIHTLAILTENSDPLKFMKVDGRFHLWTIYLIWVGVILLLYMPCQWYGRYKSAHPEKWWLSYL
jgi:uncharacterized membrane protein